jgi:hypothetical protein
LRFLEAYEAHYGSFDAWNLTDLDVDDIPDELWSADHKALLDLWLDRVRESCACFEKFPPVDMLPDLDCEFETIRDGNRRNDRDVFKFSLPDGFRWPTSVALQSFAGNEGELVVDDSHSGGSDSLRMEEIERTMAEYKDNLGGVSESVVRYLRDEISENRFGLSGDSSMATLRKTIGFDMDVENVYIFHYDIQPDGGRKVICDNAHPLTKQMLASLFFDSSISAKVEKVIERRNLISDKCFFAARVLPDVKKQVLGGEQGHHFKEHDVLRIRQQTMVKNAQPSLKIIHHTSAAFAAVRTVLADHESGSVDLPVPVQAALQHSADELQKALFASSDALHLVIDRLRG